MIKDFKFDESQKFYKLLGYKAHVLRRALRQKNIVIEFFKDEKGSSRKWVAQGKNKTIAFNQTMPIKTLSGARRLTNDKENTKQILNKSGIRVPKGIVIDASDFDKALDWFNTLENKKVVAKPISGSHGNGIVSAINSAHKLKTTLQNSISQKLVLEEHIDGFDHRILVVGGKVIAAMKRWPSNVVGDGRLTVHELVQLKNKTRIKNPFDGRFPVVINDESLRLLSEQGIDSNGIPKKGQRIYLRTVSNIGSGGEGEDVTDMIHPDFIKVAEDCWRAFDDVECCGVDMMLSDISQPADAQSHAVIEINVNCDIPIHHWPAIGRPIDVASYIADHYFPDDELELNHAAKVVIQCKSKGVGYTKWLARQAVLFGLTGYCKNLNGTVEVLIEGSKNSIDSVLRMCAAGPGKITPVDIHYEFVPHERNESFKIL
ncbi:acylphosphatase [Halomonas sp. AOP12-C2-37]|uniref:Acylphosphatase n=1 Tax=Halomonas casei TaxID=2742613 RepID=A0ABR9EXY6_9GAMM|nr:acylphosphatase [Halomonas casei]MBE0398964.1 acylphosphatase [Halomonas casei]